MSKANTGVVRGSETASKFQWATKGRGEKQGKAEDPMNRGDETIFRQRMCSALGRRTFLLSVAFAASGSSV